MATQQESSTTETATSTFGAINLLTGLLGLFGPAVSGNDEELINIQPGHLLGVAAINWLHALLHFSYGVLGIKIGRSSSSSRAFMGVSAVFWGVLAVIGWRATGVNRDIHVVMGLALDAGANVVHTVWSGVGLVYVLRSDRPSSKWSEPATHRSQPSGSSREEGIQI